MNGTFFDGKTALGAPVQVTLDGVVLRLSVAGGALDDWPVAALRRCDPGAAGDAATFRRGGPERLVIADPALLAQLRAAGVAFGGDAPWNARRWAAFAAALVVSIAVCAVAVDRLPALAAPLVPGALERNWSQAIETVLGATAKTCSTREADAALHGMVARLSAAAGIGRLPALTVLDTGLVNAFTLPDGRILLLRGLIEKAHSPDELAGVLSHELGHVRRHDPTREMLRGLALDMVARSLGWASSVAGNMAALSYGRSAEAAADASAVVTLRGAGLRADGLRSFFLRLQREARDAPIPFLSDHPATSARIAALPADAAGTAALDAGAWVAVQTVCAAGKK